MFRKTHAELFGDVKKKKKKLTWYSKVIGKAYL
jgi:hypothetical protein